MLPRNLGWCLFYHFAGRVYKWSLRSIQYTELVQASDKGIIELSSLNGTNPSLACAFFNILIGNSLYKLAYPCANIGLGYIHVSHGRFPAFIQRVDAPKK